MQLKMNAKSKDLRILTIEMFSPVIFTELEFGKWEWIAIEGKNNGTKKFPNLKQI